MKKLLSLLLVVVLCLSFVACNKAKEADTSTETVKPADETTAPVAEKVVPEEKVTLRIYAQYSDDDTKVPYDYAVAELAKEYPNVTLELEVQAQDDGQKLSTYAATGNLPDIFQVGLTQINTFKESGNILVLDDYVKSTGFGDQLAANSENLLWTEDGHAYAFPYAGNEMVLLYYNKAIFEQYGVKVPETYEELKTAVETFTANDIIPLSIFAKEGWITTALYDVFATRLNSKGVAGLDAGEAKASDESYKVAAQRLEELVDLGLVADGATNMNYDQAAALFYESKAAMFINGQWEIQAATDSLGDQVDWMWYPALEENPDTTYAFSGSGSAGGYGVSPFSKNKDLAVEVAAFLSVKYCEAKYLYRANPLLAVKVDGLTPDVPFPAMMEKLASNLDKITTQSAFTWGLSNPTFKAAIEEQTQFLLTKGYSADEFVAEVDKVIESAK